MTSILFVCTGNICRSPTAHWVMHNLAQKNIIPLKIDSAGTHAHHVGEKADSRSSQIAKQRGIDMSAHKARKLDFADFYEFDLLLAMDETHLDFMRRSKPHNSTAQIELFLEYAGLGTKDVADPYYGGIDGFEKVFTQIQQGCNNLLDKFKGSNTLTA